MRTSGIATCVSAVCLSLAACSDHGNVAEKPLDLEEPLQQPGDKAGAAACSPDRFPRNVGNPISCCQDGHRTWHTNDGKTLGHRVFAEPCTLADGVNHNCSGRDCVYGPCGARIEWAVTAQEVHVFKPISNPDKCGWEAMGVVACRVGCDWPAGPTREFPESFNGQEQHAGLTSTCPYTDCSNGVPVITSPP